MADLPGRPAYEPEDREDAPTARPEEEGWGSPLPAEYGSLQAVPASSRRGSSSARRSNRARSGEGSSMASLLRRIQGVEPAAATTNGGRALDAGPDTDEPPQTIRRSAQPDMATGRLGQPTDWAPPDQAPPDATLIQPPVEPAPAEPGPYRPRRRERAEARRASRIRNRATIRHVDIAAVAKVSLVFYFIVLLVVVVASVLLWYAADAFGTLNSFEKSIRTLFSLKSFTVHPGTVAMYTAAGGVVLAVAGTIANILMACVYNLISDVVGGVRVELEQHPGD